MTEQEVQLKLKQWTNKAQTVNLKVGESTLASSSIFYIDYSNLPANTSKIVFEFSCICEEFIFVFTTFLNFNQR